MIFISDSLGRWIEISGATLWSVVGVVLAVFVAFYLFRAIGLFVMAKRQKMNVAYLAWIPFAWIYLAGKLCKAKGVFGFKVKNFALILTLVYCISEVITLTFTLVTYIPLVGYLLQGGDVLYSTTPVVSAGYTSYPLASGIYLQNFIFPYGDGVISALRVLNIISMIVEIFHLVFLYTMYFNLFRAYWPAHFFSAFIFSFFGLFPVFVFALRKKEPVDYEAFIKARYGDYANRQNPYYNDPFLHGPNGGHEGQNHANTNPFEEFDGGKAKENSEPFGEFDKNKADPFDEFDGGNGGDE